jgi:hypothetical protein
MTEAHHISQIATPIAYVALKLRKRSNSMPPAEGGEGGKVL